jgi:hypothetical protein
VTSEAQRKEQHPEEYCANPDCTVRLGSQYPELRIDHCLAHMWPDERAMIDQYMRDREKAASA